MIQNGEYSAWYKTPRGQGTGIIRLANGKITGGDSALSYSGWYEVEQDRFTATLSTRRYAAGQVSLFGVDEVELRIVGISSGTIARCTGSAAQAPGLPFQATLIRVQEQPQVAAPIASEWKYAGSPLELRRPLVSPAMRSRL
jgi:hypothetical protein